MKVSCLVEFGFGKLAKDGNDSHHPSTADGLAQAALGLDSEACLSAGFDEAHLSDEVGHDQRVGGQ